MEPYHPAITLYHALTTVSTESLTTTDTESLTKLFLAFFFTFRRLADRM